MDAASPLPVLILAVIIAACFIVAALTRSPDDGCRIDGDFMTEEGDHACR